MVLCFQHKVLRTLGCKVVESDPPEEDRLPLLNEVWKFLAKVKNPKVQFLAQFCVLSLIYQKPALC